MITDDTKLELQLNKTYTESEILELNLDPLNKNNQKFLTHKTGRKIYFFERTTKGFHLFDIVDQLKVVK